MEDQDDMDTPRTPYVLILLIWSGGVCAAMQFAKMSVIFPLIEAAYPDAGSGLGFLVSLLSLLGLGLGVVAGVLSARIGFRRALIWALALGAALSLVQASLPPLWIMLVSRILEGLTHLAVVVVAPTMIAQLATDRTRPFFMTLWGSFFGVAFVLTSWLGVPLAEAGGVPTLFVAHAIVTGLVACLLAVALPPEEKRTLPLQPVRWAAILREHVAIYRSARMAAPAVGWIFYTLTFVSLVTVLPVLAPQENAAPLRLIMPLAGIAVSLTLGAVLLRYMSAVQVLLLGFVASMALAVAVWWWPASLWPPIALFAALGLVQGASFAAVPQLNKPPQDRARANGAMAQCGNLGNLLGTPLLLAILAGLGWNGVLLFMLLAYAAGIAAHLVASRKRASAEGIASPSLSTPRC